jgi:carboxypeptidase T
MKKLFLRRSVVAVVVTLAPLALLIAYTNIAWLASAQVLPAGKPSLLDDRARQARHWRLEQSLSSSQSALFKQALAELDGMDEPGALALWKSALNNNNSNLKRQAWDKYRERAGTLSRKELVPQVVRAAAGKDELLRVARQAGLEATVWSEASGQTIAAIPPYLVERLRAEGISLDVLYDSIAEYQLSRARGDLAAQAITSDYQAEQSQVRIAVLNLAQKQRPAPGYSDWTADRENIVLRNESFIAHLDLFPSDGSTASVREHIEQEYTRRGVSLAGFYTVAEFASSAPRFFPGETFDAGSTAKGSLNSYVKPALSEGKFHSYDETLSEFTELARSHPDIARLVSLGQSYEGRQVFALKISKNPELEDSIKPDVLIMGCHHAREWIAVEPPVYFANQLVNLYSTDDSIKFLVDRLEIWVVPIVNPDGLVYSQGSQNDRLDSVRLWRKNRRPISAAGCGSSVGVDLNRNYDFKWRLDGDEPCPNYSDDVGGSDNPENESYRGSKPESESEVKAIKTLLDDPQRHFRAQLDYHNYSQLVLYPWGHQTFAAPDHANLSQLAERMAGEIFKVDSQVYKPEQAIDLYATTGSSIDYAYGVKQVAAPFLVELRPLNGSFVVRENEIAPINQENWAGARVVLSWAAGPPILESVKVYQAAPDGNFTKLVYSARWSATREQSAETREMEVETRFPGIEPGRLQVRLQFSKPMDSSSPPRATLGRDTRLDELQLAAEFGTQGWQKTAYLGDTWVGEVVIPQDQDLTNPWRLAVSASDPLSFKLDGSPQTIASYGTGTGRWRNYEDSSGEGAEGGTDSKHRLSPTLKGDGLTLFVGSPGGGERLPAAEPFTVRWTLPSGSGFIPVEQQIWLSTDGGLNFAPITDPMYGNLDKAEITLPRLATTRARIRVGSREGVFGNTLFGDSLTDFTIAMNVGAGVSWAFVSSELVTQNWSDAAVGDLPPATGPLRLAITLNVTNRGQTAIASPFLRVADINRSNVLLTRDRLSNASAGARQSFDAAGDNILSPGETAQTRLIVGLTGKKKFDLSVELFGVPTDGTIAPASGFKAWKGKPRSK